MAILAAVPDVRQVLPWVASLVIVVLALFSILTVRAAEGWLHCQFGLGLIRRRIALSDVQHAETVRNHWWHGWGIRLTRHGWLWNVSGLGAMAPQLLTDYSLMPPRGCPGPNLRA